MSTSWIRGAGLTPFGSQQAESTLSLMHQATQLALQDADIDVTVIDGVICGYSTTMPHLMLANVFAEYAGIRPQICHGMQVGGATGLSMIALAHAIVSAGRAENILVVAGENRLTGQTRDMSIQTLAQVGHDTYEAALGLTVPAYYALLASEYYHAHKITERDAAEFAVLMRAHAARRDGAHLNSPISIDDVLASKAIALPLRLLDCCPISDGGAAVVVSKSSNKAAQIRVRGSGQAHQHQHLTAIKDIDNVGALTALNRACADGKITIADTKYAAIYDSFTATLVILLEEIGLAPRGKAAAFAREGFFGQTGKCPLNLHGGLLSYGHCGVAGGMAHFVEAYLQLSNRAGARQCPEPDIALIHADGGVMSAHVSVFLERVH